MSKTDAILLGALIGVLLITVFALLVRNRQLARGQRIWMDLATRPRPTEPPLPQAARMISMTQFDRATDRLHGDVRRAEEARYEVLRQLALANGEKDEWMRKAQERAIRLSRLEPELAAEKSERERLAGLYKEADLERQRLRLENGRLREERRTSVN